MDHVVRNAEPEALIAEIRRLAREVERLESRLEQLDRLACMDTLVPAANRRGLLKALEMVLARHERHGVPAAVLFIDVNGLKAINDSHGHAAGDAALVHLTELMSRNVRKSDLVARLGGDEFAILLDHSSDSVAKETARRLAVHVGKSDFLYQGEALELSVAIGMAMIEPGDTPERVLDRADRAMYLEKNAA